MPFRKEDDYAATDLIRVAGMGTAIGLGVRKWWQLTNFNQIVESHRIPSAYQKATSVTQNALAQFGANASRVNKFNQIGLDNLISAIEDEKIFATSTDIKSALLRAAERHDPSGNLVQRLTNRLEEGAPPAALLREMQETTRLAGSSIYVQRTVSSFLEDIQTLEMRLAEGKGITPYALPEMQIGNLTNVSWKQLESRGGLAEVIKNIGAELKGKITLKQWERPGQTGSQLGIEISGSPYLARPKTAGAAQLSLRIPMSLSDEPGVLFHGATQQSKYIAGEYWLVEKLRDEWRLKRRMRYEEWAARRFLEQEIPKITTAHRLSRRQTHAIESAYHQEIMKPLEWVDTLSPGQHLGQDEYIRMRQQVARLQAAGRELSDIEYGEILRSGLTDEEATDLFSRHLQVYPSSSPTQMTRNLVSTQDWREMSLIPEAFDWSKRPLQGIRREFAPTLQAQGAIARNRLTNMYSWAARKGGSPAAMIRTMYVKSSMAPELAQLGLNIEGGGLISRTKLPMLAQEELVRYSVSSEGLLDLKHILGNTKQASWEGGQVIPAGAVLGYSPEGSPVTVEEPFTLLGANRYQDMGKKDFIKLTGVRRLEDMRWFKSFGDAKAMMGVVPAKHISRVVQTVTGSDTPHHLPIQAIVAMDELKKNRALHYKQMFTALHEFTRQNMARGRMPSSTFYRNPGEVIAQLRKKAFTGGQLQHNLILQEAVQLAKQGQLTPEQMGSVFGAVPEVFGEGWSTGLGLSSEEVLAITRGTPVGLAQFSFGGRYGPGSGGLGTIEPRMFELLSAPHLGTLGPEVQEEIMTRMLYRYPGRVREGELLAQTAQSLLYPKGNVGIVPSQWTTELGQSGGLLNIPGIGDVSIPPAESMRQLASYKTSTGIEVTPELNKDFEQLINDARKFEAGQIERSAMEETVDATRQAVQRAQAATITGKDALLRGRLLGSRFLTSVPMAHTFGLGLGREEVGITAPYAGRMAKELSAIHGENVAEELMQRLKAGESVGALAMRHPFIGPYSTSPVKVKLIPGNEPIAVFGEQYARATLADTGEALGNLRFSPAVGMAMDYDADIVNVMLLPKNLEQKAAKVAITQQADEYAIRTQLLKAKKASAGALSLTDPELAAEAALKLRIPKERLGLISESLQVARASVLANTQKLSSQRTMNALGLLEWLEQTPISGKHIQPGKTKTMITSLTNIRQALTSRNHEKLIRNVESIVGQGTLGERFMRQGGRVIAETAQGRKGFDVPGINVEQAVSDIMTGIGSFEKQTPEGLSASRWRQIIRGRGAGVSATEAKAIPGFLRSVGPEVSPFAALWKTIDRPGTMAAATREVGILRNRVASFGGKLLEHAKPIGLGIGAALGIATLFSAPPKSMKMPLPRNDQMPPGGTGGANISPEEVAASEVHRRQMEGSPSVQNAMGATNTAPVMPNSVSISVRGKSRGDTDFHSMNSQISKVLGGAQISSRVLDNRRSLSSHSIAKILKEDE